MDSLIGQTLSDIEIILVDDGSTDRSADILARYAEADERVRVIRQANQGQGGARNTGLDAASG
ncbi:glycosyltransferase, partial [Marinobacter sp. 71-i]